MKNTNYLLSQKVSLLNKLGIGLTRSVALLVLLLISSSVFSQETRQITGVVNDEKGEPVIGATVVVDGTTNGVITDFNGKFSLNVSVKAEKIKISFIGFETQLVAIKGKKKFTIVMLPKTEMLGDIVVVGYGQQKKESIVGAISQTSAKVLERSGGVTNLGSALTGRLPGVITYTSSGQPGQEDPRIIIRSSTSWNGSDPLILVDGIERSMSDVDISSVASVSVLKDASATAVYGVRGANGVILITTKRGKEGKANIQVRANSTMKIPSKLPEKLDAYDALILRNQSIERELASLEDSWGKYSPMGFINKYRNPANLAQAERYPNVDWADHMFKDFAMAHNASVNVSGGTKLVKYFSAVDFLHEGDLFKLAENNEAYQSGFSYNRINVRSNLDFRLTPTTQFSSNLFGSNGVRETPWDFSGGFPWASAYKTAPDAMLPVYADGNWGYHQPWDADQPNSVYLLANSGNEKQTTAKITTDFSLKQDLDFVTEGLKFEATYSYDNTFLEVDRGINNMYNNDQRKWIDPLTGTVWLDKPVDSSTQLDFINPVAWSTDAGHVQTGNTFRRQYYSVRLNYSRKFGNHNVTGLALFSREKSTYGSDFARFREDWVFRATYNLLGKYFFEANGAYNGTEKFGPGYRFEFFPSVSAGWMISEEKFFMKSLSFIDMLKIRGSWGIIGDDSTGQRWLYSDFWTYGDSRAILGINLGNESPYANYRQIRTGNPDMMWEVVQKLNVGFDYSIFDGLVAGSFDYFTDHRTDIIVEEGDRAVPTFTGGGVPTANLGEVKSAGFELEIRLSKSFSNDFRVWGNINLNHAKNEVIFRDDAALLPAYQKEQGFAIGQTRSFIDAGYLTTWDDVLGSTPRIANDRYKIAGDYNIIDFNGDGVIDQFDQVPYGYSGTPQNTYSTTLGLDWKGFNVSMQFYGVSNVSREVFFPTFDRGLNNAYVEGSYWTVSDGGEVPLPRWKSPLGFGAEGTRYRYDGSYLRLKTAEIGYTFSQGWTKQVGINTCKFYVSGNNLFLWSDLPDDRESNFSGNSRDGAYPTFRRVTLGLDITF